MVIMDERISGPAIESSFGSSEKEKKCFIVRPSMRLASAGWVSGAVN